jgi:hypothetical protein
MTLRTLLATLLLSAVATLGVAAAESAINPPASESLEAVVAQLRSAPEAKRQAIAARWLKSAPEERFAAAEDMLFAGASEAQSEELFLPFVEARLADKKLSETDRSVLQWKRDVCLTNAPGTTAADVDFLTADGASHSLLQWVAADTTAATMLLLYDPECHHCREVILELTQMTPSLPYRVLAICLESTRQRWLDTIDQLPAQWTRAFDLSDIVVNEQYVIRSMPQIYLIDPSGKVIAKNPALKCLNL